MTIKTERLLARAKKLKKKGKLEEAKKIYSEIVKSSPKNQEAIKEFSSLNKKIELNPTQFQLDEVMQKYSENSFHEALSKVQILIQSFPNHPLLFNICGACQKAIGSLDSAILSFEKAIDLKQDYAEAHYNLGVAYQNMNNLSDASECYRKAIAITPNYPAAHMNLGVVFLRLEDYSSAIENLEWAIAFNPENAEAYNNLGSVYSELQQFELAKDKYKKAVSIQSNFAVAYNNLGITYASFGNKDKAKISYQKAIEANADFAEAHFNLSSIKKYTKNDSQIVEMQSLLSSRGLSQSDQTFVNFALAKVNDDLGNQNELFKFLNEGNRLRKEQLDYPVERYKDEHSIIKKIFTQRPAVINRDLGTKKTSKKPIFIVGMPRSGTSLVEQILANHHQVSGAGELNMLSKICNSLLKDSSVHTMNGLTKKTLLAIRKQYFDSLSIFNIDKSIFTDKWPLNFQYIGFILSAFPEAKIIHLERDARAVCWSIYRHYFSGNGNAWAYNFEDIVYFYGLYSEMMKFWHDLFPNKIYNINYETLTTNQKNETKKLLDYCELDWDDNCLNFHTNTRAVNTASNSQVRKKMYQGSSEDWKKYEKHIKPLIKGLSSF